jgi:tetratricopeptide (TPR) repeat protein
MEYKLRQISPAGITEAIAKVELYRSLNEPEEAESICRDILTIEPQHQLALRLLGLAITDQFTGGGRDRDAEAHEVFQRLTDRYERTYYAGIAYERRAKAQLRAGQPAHTLRALFEGALRCFDEAEKMRPVGNDDAILRWNRCVRLLQSSSYAWSEEHTSFEAHDSPPT